MANATHMHYLLDLLNAAPGDWLAKMAWDVAQEYNTITTLLCAPAIKCA